MEKKEIKNEKLNIGGIISVIYTLVTLLIGAYVGFMAIYVFVLTKLGWIGGKFSHNLAYFLSLITVDEKFDLEEKEDQED